MNYAYVSFILAFVEYKQGLVRNWQHVHITLFGSLKIRFLYPCAEKFIISLLNFILLNVESKKYAKIKK